MSRRLADLVIGGAALLLAASTSQAAVITAYYDFEGVGDDRFDDPAGVFADNLVGQFNPAFSTDTPGAFAGTQSASFNGDSALYTGAYTSDLGPAPDAWTIMFWVKGRDIDQENDNTRLFGTTQMPDGSNNNIAMNWQVEGFGHKTDGQMDGTFGDRMDVRSHDVSPGWFAPSATNALARQDQGETVAQWHHVAFIVSRTGHPVGGGSYTRTFVDGVQTGLDNEDFQGQPLHNTLGQLIIGSDSQTAGNRAFVGLLDDIALFGGVVSDADIAAIASGSLSPSSFIAIPEPASIALLGLGGVMMLRRRTR